MKVGKKIKRVHKISRPIKVNNWPKPKPVPVDIPEKKEVEVK